MTMLDILPLEERNRVVEIHKILNDLIPLVTQLNEEGYPLANHLESLSQRRIWNDKMLKTFQIQVN